MWFLLYFVILGAEPLAWTHPIAFHTEEECHRYVAENEDLALLVNYYSAFCVYDKESGIDH